MRMILGKKKAARRKEIYLAAEKERKEIEELEKMVEGMHSSWLTELFAIRAQSGVRAMLAKA